MVSLHRALAITSHAPQGHLLPRNAVADREEPRTAYHGQRRVTPEDARARRYCSHFRHARIDLKMGPRRAASKPFFFDIDMTAAAAMRLLVVTAAQQRRAAYGLMRASAAAALAAGADAMLPFSMNSKMPSAAENSSASSSPVRRQQDASIIEIFISTAGCRHHHLMTSTM